MRYIVPNMFEIKRIGLAIDAVAAYGRGVIRGIMAFCRAHPHWVVTEEPRWSFAQRPNLAEWDVDGLIVQIYSREFEDEVLARGLPAVNVSNFCDAHRLPTIIPDDTMVGAMAADYLMARGFKDLGFCWPGDVEYGQLRIESFRQRVLAAGSRFYECDARHRDIGEWITTLPKPSAVLACNDDWAHRVLKSARRAGVKVPDQVAVLGVDNDELFNTLVTPSISSVALPAEQIGYEAAARLDLLMGGATAAATTVRLAPLRVVTKESTEVLSVDDPEVAMALQFIREHAARPLMVDDLLEHVPLSRRSLERRFRTVLGRSVSDEIRRVHIERAKQLLISTDLSMPQVATASGFTTATRLGIVFQKDVGEPPTLFRKRSRAGGRTAVGGVVA